MAEPVALDPKKVSDKQLEAIKIEYAEEIGQVVAQLCNEAGRTDGVAIIKRIADDMEQILLVGQEQGRRSEVKRQEWLKEQHDDTTTG